MNRFVQTLGLAFLAASVCAQNCVEETLDCNGPVTSIYKLGDASCACNRAEHAGALKYDNVKVSVCLGSDWKTVQFEENHAYGTEINPGYSCKDILDKAEQPLSNGVFWIRLRGNCEMCLFLSK